MRKWAKKLLRKGFQGLGIEVTRHRDSTGAKRLIFKRTNYRSSRNPDSMEARRLRFMRTKGVSLVLDVGANTGQYAMALRRSGYRGRIVSFEPLNRPFRELREHCSGDRRWECRQLAVGEREGSVPINVSGNVVSSSLLPMLTRHAQAAPDSTYVGREVANMTTLDSLIDQLIGPDDCVALKLDVQGYEAAVLAGGPRTLRRAQLIETELSLVPLYEGQAAMCEVVERVQAAGFELVSLERGFVDPRTDYTLQVDGIFVRTDA